MTELYLEPGEFQEKVDSFVEGAASVKSIKFGSLDQSTRLTSVDRFQDCVEQFNATIELFGQMLDKDAASFQAVKSAWMHVDESIGNYTFGDLVGQAFDGLMGGGDGK